MVTVSRNDWSRLPGIGGHTSPEWVVRVARNMQNKCGKKYLLLNHQLILRSLLLELKGTQVDRLGTKLYGAINSEPLHKWQKTICNPLRAYWCKKYIMWLGEQRLKNMGYDQQEILSSLSSARWGASCLLSDAARLVYGLFVELLEFGIFKKKLCGNNSWRQWVQHN